MAVGPSLGLFGDVDSKQKLCFFIGIYFTDYIFITTPLPPYIYPHNKLPSCQDRNPVIQIINVLGAVSALAPPSAVSGSIKQIIYES